MTMKAVNKDRIHQLMMGQLNTKVKNKTIMNNFGKILHLLIIFNLKMMIY